MRFPAKPRDLDPGFYRALHDYCLEMEMALRELRIRPEPSFVQVESEPLPNASYELAAAATLNQEEMNRWHFINCSTAADLTLPAGAEGMWIGIYNWGGSNITLKNPATTTLATLTPFQKLYLISIPDTSGAFEWPSPTDTAAMVQGSEEAA